MANSDFNLSVGFSFKHLGAEAREHEHSKAFKECVKKVCQQKLGPLDCEYFAPPSVPLFAADKLLVPMQTVREWLEAFLDSRAPQGHGLAVDTLLLAGCRLTSKGWEVTLTFAMTQDGETWRSDEIVAEYEKTNPPQPWNKAIKDELADIEITALVGWITLLDPVPC